MSTASKVVAFVVCDYDECLGDRHIETSTRLLKQINALNVAYLFYSINYFFRDGDDIYRDDISFSAEISSVRRGRKNVSIRE